MMTSFEGKLFFFFLKVIIQVMLAGKQTFFFWIAAHISFLFFQSFIITVTCLSQLHTNDCSKGYIIIMKGIHFPVIVPKKAEL